MDPTVIGITQDRRCQKLRCENLISGQNIFKIISAKQKDEIILTVAA
jgi:hypothetical protein